MKRVSALFMMAVLAVLSCLPGLAEAKTIKLTAAKPVATVTIPDSWKPEEYDLGVEAQSPDDEVYVAVEVSSVKGLENAAIEALKFYQKQGVTLQGDPVQSEHKLNGMDVVDLAWKGRDKDGEAEVSLSFVVVSESRILLLYYWGSPKGGEKHRQALSGILNSIKRL
ncbi:MAG: hypothetical protein J0H82_03300 [Alphaproteobacteria bacterium]|nr:hypothetical protein [Alphaproteobacteria bacterium]